MRTQGLDTSSIEKMRSDLLNDSQRLRWQTLNEVLTTEQNDKMSFIVSQYELVAGGFVYAAVHGSFGKLLGITEPQKVLIRELGKRWEKKLERETRDWEQETNEQLMAALPEQSRAILQQLMGSEIENGPVNVDLLVEQLGRMNLIR